MTVIPTYTALSDKLQEPKVIGRIKVVIYRFVNYYCTLLAYECIYNAFVCNYACAQRCTQTLKIS